MRISQPYIYIYICYYYYGWEINEIFNDYDDIFVNEIHKKMKSWNFIMLWWNFIWKFHHKIMILWNFYYEIFNDSRRKEYHQMYILLTCWFFDENNFFTFFVTAEWVSKSTLISKCSTRYLLEDDCIIMNWVLF